MADNAGKSKFFGIFIIVLEILAGLMVGIFGEYIAVALVISYIVFFGLLMAVGWWWGAYLGLVAAFFVLLLVGIPFAKAISFFLGERYSKRSGIETPSDTMQKAEKKK